MQQGQFLYDIVYQYIKSGILLGFLKKGMYLPSLQTYGELFGVSPLTVRGGVQKLQRENFVILSRGKPTVVNWETSPEQIQEYITQYLLSRRNALIDLDKTVALFYPDILFQSLWVQDESGLQDLEETLRSLDSGHVQNLVSFVIRMVKSLGNPLILRLFMDTYIFTQFADLWELHKNRLDHPELLEEVQTQFQRLIGARRDESPTEMMEVLHWAYRTSHIAQVAANTPEQDASEQTAFQWEPNKGQTQYVYQVVLDIMRAIADEDYPPFSYLPSIQQLAGQYGLSEQTLRQVMKLLCSIGMTKSAGSFQYQVYAWEGSKAVSDILSDPGIRKNMLLFLRTFQFFAIVGKPLAKHSAPLLPQQVRERLIERMKQDLRQEKSFALRETVELLMEYSGLDAVKEICGQFFEYLLWGHSSPFRKYRPEEKACWDNITQKIIFSLEQNDPDAFSLHLQSLIYHYYLFNKDVLLRYGVTEVEHLSNLHL